MELTETRRARLKAWFANRTLPTEEKSYLSQLIGGKASFGEKAARRLEQTYGMPPMWLDTPLDEVAPVVEKHTGLIAALELLTQEQRQEFIEQIKARADTNKAILEQLSPPEVKKRTVSVSERRLSQAKIPFAERRKHAKQNEK